MTEEELEDFHRSHENDEESKRNDNLYEEKEKENLIHQDIKNMDNIRKYESNKNDDDSENNNNNNVIDRLNQVNTKKGIFPERHTTVIVDASAKPIGPLIKRFPGAIIAGTKKSGTRALLSFLARHPLIRSAGKEMHFFDKNRTYAKGLAWYFDQMPMSHENEITIEKTPAYFVKPMVPERIYNFSKNIKLIFIFRDPVRRAISDYAQGLAKNNDRRPFRAMITKKRQPDVIDPRSNKVNVGLYLNHLRRWLQYFPLKQMHFVNGDDFSKNPAPELKLVQQFLNMEVLVNEQSFVFNKTKGFYCIRVIRESTQEEEIDCLSATKGRKHPNISDDVIRLLTEFYRPYNRDFFNFIGRDFGWPS